MACAGVCREGNSQAVRLPKEFRLLGPEVDIFRRGDAIVLRERQPGLSRAVERLWSLPDDFLTDRDDAPPQERDGL